MCFSLCFKCQAISSFLLNCNTDSHKNVVKCKNDSNSLLLWICSFQSHAWHAVPLPVSGNASSTSTGQAQVTGLCLSKGHKCRPLLWFLKIRCASYMQKNQRHLIHYPFYVNLQSYLKDEASSGEGGFLVRGWISELWSSSACQIRLLSGMYCMLVDL